MIIVQLSGGLGNQMFQYACGKALAVRKKTKLVLDERFLEMPDPLITPREYGLHAFHTRASLFDDVPDQQKPDEFTLIVEAKHFIYDPALMEQVTQNTYLWGYWQSWTYFQDIDPLIRKQFRFTQQGFSSQCMQLAVMIQQQQSVSIHVRRTDYLKTQNDYIGTLPISYYRDAIQYITKYIPQPIFYIFSDDPDWAEENITSPHEMHIVRGNSNIEDLFLMSQCQHNIIANSTYSWWGAWLNASPKKIVIAPGTWLIGQNVKPADTDILPPGWITLKIDQINNDDKQTHIMKPLPVLLTNIFNSKHKDSVLISSITKPFTNGLHKVHSNFFGCYTAAEIFDTLGYCVDVADYDRANLTIDYSKYSILYGMGIPFENVFHSDYYKQIIKIIYSPGCNTYYSVPKSVQRVKDFYKEKGILMLDSARVDGLFTSQYMLADSIIVLGNDFVASTHRSINPDVHIQTVKAFYFDAYNPDIDRKNFRKAKKNFLWFGSMGCIHKGLDIVIDYFSQHTDLQLHICGYVEYEKRFWEYYAPIIDKCKNIHYYGFVYIESDLFKELMDTCAFTVYPSVSEGGSPSVVNTIANGGLIPIISKSSGVDIAQDQGWVFEDISIETLGQIVRQASAMKDEALRKMARNANIHFREHYTFEKYKLNLRNAIESCMTQYLSRP